MQSNRLVLTALWITFSTLYGLILSPFACATTVSFTPTKDNLLFSDDLADNNFGDAAGIVVGKNAGNQLARSILGFDVSSLANQNITVQSITLRLTTFAANTPSAAFNVDVHELVESNEGWVAGNGVNTPALPGESDWNFKAAGPSPSAWTGGAGLGSTGYEATILASLLVGNSVTGTVGIQGDFNFTGSSAALTSLIGTWALDPDGANLVVIGTNDGSLDSTQRWIFSSSEGVASVERPTLLVTYTAAPEPSSLLLAFGGAFVLCVMRRTIIVGK